jgi:hypothetical protein
VIGSLTAIGPWSHHALEDHLPPFTHPPVNSGNRRAGTPAQEIRGDPPRGGKIGLRARASVRHPCRLFATLRTQGRKAALPMDAQDDVARYCHDRERPSARMTLAQEFERRARALDYGGQALRDWPLAGRRAYRPGGSSAQERVPHGPLRLLGPVYEPGRIREDHRGPADRNAPSYAVILSGVLAQ